MKDTKTVLPAVNGEAKNGFHQKNKSHENGNDEQRTFDAAASMKNGLDSEELVGGCCVCSDDQGFANNALVYCDGKGCTVACHTGRQCALSLSSCTLRSPFSVLRYCINTGW